MTPPVGQQDEEAPAWTSAAAGQKPQEDVFDERNPPEGTLPLNASDQGNRWQRVADWAGRDSAQAAQNLLQKGLSSRRANPGSLRTTESPMVKPLPSKRTHHIAHIGHYVPLWAQLPPGVHIVCPAALDDPRTASLALERNQTLFAQQLMPLLTIGCPAGKSSGHLVDYNGGESAN
jgi:hypothetical protein